MKLFELVRYGKEELDESETPLLDSELLAVNLLKKDRTFIYLNRDLEVDEHTFGDFKALLARRKQGEPLQYITGKQEFMSINFLVGPGVLIPRPDTEILVEEVLKLIKDIPGPVIADAGCGSGAIGISLAYYNKSAFVYMLDIMDDPLNYTNINAEEAGVCDRINIQRSDMLKELYKLDIKLDVIVSNPPYIKETVIPELMKEVKDYEPYEALSGGMDGLCFYRSITEDAAELLKEGGILAFEIGYDQKEEVSDILKNNGFRDIKCIKDLAGLDRVVTGIR